MNNNYNNLVYLLQRLLRITTDFPKYQLSTIGHLNVLMLDFYLNAINYILLKNYIQDWDKLQYCVLVTLFNTVFIFYYNYIIVSYSVLPYFDYNNQNLQNIEIQKTKSKLQIKLDFIQLFIKNDIEKEKGNILSDVYMQQDQKQFQDISYVCQFVQFCVSVFLVYVIFKNKDQGNLLIQYILASFLIQNIVLRPVLCQLLAVVWCQRSKKLYNLKDSLSIYNFVAELIGHHNILLMQYQRIELQKQIDEIDDQSQNSQLMNERTLMNQDSFLVDYSHKFRNSLQSQQFYQVNNNDSANINHRIYQNQNQNEDSEQNKTNPTQKDQDLFIIEENEEIHIDKNSYEDEDLTLKEQCQKTQSQNFQDNQEQIIDNMKSEEKPRSEEKPKSDEKIEPNNKNSPGKNDIHVISKISDRMFQSQQNFRTKTQNKQDYYVNSFYKDSQNDDLGKNDYYLAKNLGNVKSFDTHSISNIKNSRQTDDLGLSIATIQNMFSQKKETQQTEQKYNDYRQTSSRQSDYKLQSAQKAKRQRNMIDYGEKVFYAENNIYKPGSKKIINNEKVVKSIKLVSNEKVSKKKKDYGYLNQILDESGVLKDNCGVNVDDQQFIQNNCSQSSINIKDQSYQNYGNDFIDISEIKVKQKPQPRPQKNTEIILNEPFMLGQKPFQRKMENYKKAELDKRESLRTMLDKRKEKQKCANQISFVSIRDYDVSQSNQSILNGSGRKDKSYLLRRQ